VQQEFSIIFGSDIITIIVIIVNIEHANYFSAPGA